MFDFWLILLDRITIVHINQRLDAAKCVTLTSRMHNGNASKELWLFTFKNLLKKLIITSLAIIAGGTYNVPLGVALIKVILFFPSPCRMATPTLRLIRPMLTMVYSPHISRISIKTCKHHQSSQSSIGLPAISNQHSSSTLMQCSAIHTTQNLAKKGNTHLVYFFSLLGTLLLQDGEIVCTYCLFLLEKGWQVLVRVLRCFGVMCPVETELGVKFSECHTATWHSPTTTYWGGYWWVLLDHTPSKNSCDCWLAGVLVLTWTEVWPKIDLACPA